MYVAQASGGLRRLRSRGMRGFHGDLGKQRVRKVSLSNDGTVWVIDGGRGIRRRSYSDTTGAYIDKGGTNFEDIAAISASVAWAVKRNGDVEKTTDGGTNWATVAVPSGVDMKSIAAGNDGTVWALDDEGNMYSYDASTDNWFDQSDDRTFRALGVGKSTDVIAVEAMNDHYGKSFRYLGIEAKFRSLASTIQDAVETFALEPLECARELFFDEGTSGSAYKRRNMDFRYEADNNVQETNPWRDEPYLFSTDGADPGTDLTKIQIPVGIDPDSAGRDQYGQLEDYEDKGFEFENYVDLVENYRGCAAEFVAEFNDQVNEALNGVTDVVTGEEIFEDQIEGFMEGLKTQCLQPEVGECYGEF